MNTTTAALTSEEVVDFFDTVLDHTWTRRYDDRSYAWNEVTVFTQGTHRNGINIVIDDGQIKVVEFDENGCIVAETVFTGDPTRQAPRVLAMLGVSA